MNRNRRARGQPYVPTAMFVAGYLIVWGGFSVAATLAQWALEHGRPAVADAWRSPARCWAACCSSLAGLYQFTPLKQACLRHCRSPFAFVLNHWRDGGAARCAWAWRTASTASAAAGC